MHSAINSFTLLWSSLFPYWFYDRSMLSTKLPKSHVLLVSLFRFALWMSSNLKERSYKYSWKLLDVVTVMISSSLTNVMATFEQWWPVGTPPPFHKFVLVAWARISFEILASLHFGSFLLEIDILYRVFGKQGYFVIWPSWAWMLLATQC